MASRKQEIKEYQALLKKNEQTITDLTAQNKHIKNHIKFLQSLGFEEGELSETNRWDAPQGEQL
jgi:hypothetical protein